MKVWKFEVMEGKSWVDYYRTSEAEAKMFKALLDENGEHYTWCSYPSLHNLIINMRDWNADEVSDGEMLDEVLELIYMLGL